MKGTSQPQSEGVTIHFALRDIGRSGIVFKHRELTFKEAVEERRLGHDIVVCGLNTTENHRMAQRIEASVGPWARGVPHASAGPYALPHFQPATRPPEGHSFYETQVRKARQGRPTS